ncbi:MAG: TlyA family RNA methyltransferase [Actinobacteria bacterium]|nr:TlyA family RNA methyltransferase [Actinomycetota bacterium]MBW3641411.1 TlyA family RNA methyltransferase [Actinomycetota bacterium]
MTSRVASGTVRRRLDTELVRRGLVASRASALAEIRAGRVLVGGAPAAKAGTMVDPVQAIEVLGPAPRFVGRGGEKLDAACEHFHIEVVGRRGLDAGASTGGFTDCLLQRGASQVVAVDVGYGQLHERLRADPRVLVRERTDIRSIGPHDVGGPVDVVVADVSFISLRTVLPALAALAAPGAILLALVKPQFECGRREASRGRGVVRDPAAWRRALGGVANALPASGATMMGAMVSPLTGAEGNVEFFVHARTAGADTPVDTAAPDLDAVVAEAVRLHGAG